MRRLIFALTISVAAAAPLHAQNDTTKAPPGISLTVRYSAADRPAVAVRDFAGVGTTPALIDSMSAIVRRDITYSDRYVMVSAPATLTSGTVDYKAWNSLGVWYLVTGDVVPTAAGYELTLTVHDVVYSRTKDVKRYRVPPMSAPDFRMVMHALSDEVVRVISGQPGSAATRIAVTRQNRATTAGGTGSYDLLIVDSDGFGLRRVAGGTGQLYSPAWSPDGHKLLYAVGGTQLVERDMQTGTTRVVRTGSGLQTPTYSPDGNRVAYSAWQSNREGLFEFDLSRNCCVKQISSSAREEIGPSYSPDGSQVVFMSSRLGLPHIYVTSTNGGGALLLSPYVQGMKGYYFGPDWSPTGSEVVFAGHWNSQGVFQIMIADAKRLGAQIRQITTDGDNEDPSWAPDGRHIVFSSGVSDQQLSLYVIDAVTLTKRKLVDGGKLRMSDWSSALVRAADYVVH